MRIPLSPMDYYFFRRSLYTIQFVFEYQGHLDVQKLKTNIDKAVSIFIAVGSRLKIISEKEIVLETGYSISITSQTFEDEFATKDSIEKLLTPITNCEGEALMKVLLTHTPSRSFVGFSFSHILGDGTSFFQFLNCLSQFSRSENSNSHVCNQRDLLNIPEENGMSLDDLFKFTGYIVPRPESPQGVTIENFKYSNKELKERKDLYSNQGFHVSSNDILMADLVKRFHQDIPLYKDQFIVRCPVDYRKTFGLPSGYFGNAVRDAITVFKVGEIDILSLLEIALRIHLSIQAVDRKNVEESLKCLNAIRQNHGISIFEEMGCPGLLVSNLSKFPIAKIDLGLGPPIGFHHASLNPRLGLIIPSTDGVSIQFKRPIKKEKESL